MLCDPHLCPQLASEDWSSERIQAVGVYMLGVRVTACARLNVIEHERRAQCGLRAITDPSLLDRLLNLPVGVPVSDRALWAAVARQPDGLVMRAEDRHTVTRLIEVPLDLDCVIVSAQRGRWRQSVQDVSLFAAFAARWIVTPCVPLPDFFVMDAKFYGIGLVDRRGRVVLDAERPSGLIMDGWAWLLREKTYGRWLSDRCPSSTSAVRAQSTD